MTELVESDTAHTTPTSQTLSSVTSTENSIPDETLVLQEKKMNNINNCRVEIDTSHPFESVKEAVTHFGGSAVWRPLNKSLDAEHICEEVDMAKVEEQTSLLEKDLIVKERETLEVLKELEATKRLVEELKLKLQNEVSESIATPELTPKKTMINRDVQQTDEQTSEHLAETQQNTDVQQTMINRDVQQTDEQTSEHLAETQQNTDGGLRLFPDSAPGLILLELKQAKMNLSRTTNDLADIRASVDTLSKKLEKERTSLRKTRERLTSNSLKISSLEEELNRTRHRLQLAKDAEIKGNSGNPMDVSRELQQLTFEAEQFKKMAETAKSEVLRATSEIEQTKTSIRTAEIRWFAAKKMSEAARASEAAALAEIKALSNSESSPGVLIKGPEGITLSFEEYSSLTSRAREAEELSKKRVLDAVVQVDEANISKMRILRKVEEAAEEVKTSKKALEEAQNRVEAANRGKLAVEEALRKWRSEHGQRRRSVYNSSKFKTSCPSHYRKDSRLIKVNGLNLPNDGPKPVLRPTLSIGQILSRKLLTPEEVDMGMQAEVSPEKPKVSLGQILGKQCGAVSPPLKLDKEESAHKQFSAKRKKFGFTRFSLLLAKQSKKKKQATIPSTRWSTCKGEAGA